MLLLIDNYDSFTYNLVHLFEELGAEVDVVRNDAIDASTRPSALAPDAPRHLARPRPARRTRASRSRSSAARPDDVPTLGVCLGHQAIVEAFGGEVGQAQRAPARQGERRSTHDGKGIFAGLPERVRGRPLPLARRDARPRRARGLRDAPTDGEVMGVRHRELPVDGVQFHPESVLTPLGPRSGAELPGGTR